MKQYLMNLKRWLGKRFGDKASQRQLLRANRRAFKSSSYKQQLHALRSVAPVMIIEKPSTPVRRPHPATYVAEVDLRPLPESQSGFPNWDLRADDDG